MIVYGKHVKRDGRSHISNEIIGTLRGISGHTFDTIYDLYFTRERIIAVLIRNPGDVLPSTNWISLLFTSYFSRREEEKKKDEIADERRLKSRNLSPQELLAASKKNFQLKNEDIISIYAKRDLFGRYNITFKIKIKDKQLTLNFNADKDRIREVRELFSKLYPTKFTT